MTPSPDKDRDGLPVTHPWTDKLLALDACCDVGEPPVLGPSAKVVTPLCMSRWQAALAAHPDSRFSEYITRGINDGFRIGFDRRLKVALRSCRRNIPSTYEHPEIVSQYLSKECKTGHTFGPFLGAPIPRMHFSSFGVIPKRHQPGKWRLILDLSSPQVHSVNDGIDPRLCSLQYISVDDIVRQVANAGRGALLAKSDIQHAYRLIPVHPEDRRFLGMKWQGKLYVDATLPFGLRSAPIIFSAVADALEWIVRQKGARCISHYIDDFIMVGAPASDECATHLHSFLSTCDELGVLVAKDKTEGPATRLTVLGIEIDTEAMTLQLPDDKLRRMELMLTDWSGRSSGTRRDLESLAGTLQHAASVVSSGRLFLRRIYDLLAATRHFKPHHFVRLNAECRADIEWWATFHRRLNGVSLIRKVAAVQPDVVVRSDASGNWGCGAFWGTVWIQATWDDLPIGRKAIAAKELIPIVLTAIVWGHAWPGALVEYRCDNAVVVDIINHQSAKDPLLCHLLRCLFFASAHYNFALSAKHTPGVANIAADALSRGNRLLFFSQVPRAASQPTYISRDLLLHLARHRPAWTSRDWTAWFASCFATY